MAGRGTTPFRGEKNTQWEGGYRVPMLLRWPGVIKPGTINNASGRARGYAADAARRGRRAGRQGQAAQGGVQAINRTYKVHLDGYNLMPALKGEATWPRQEFLYWTDGGDLAALRYTQYKVHFMEQRGHGLDVWQEPFVPLRFPKLVTLRGIPSSALPTRPSATGNGAWSACSCLFPRRRMSRTGWKLQGVPHARSRELRDRPGDEEAH